jgi:hypothetical protein
MSGKGKVLRGIVAMIGADYKFAAARGTYLV